MSLLQVWPLASVESVPASRHFSLNEALACLSCWSQLEVRPHDQLEEIISVAKKKPEYYYGLKSSSGYR